MLEPSRNKVLTSLASISFKYVRVYGTSSSQYAEMLIDSAKIES